MINAHLPLPPYNLHRDTVPGRLHLQVTCHIPRYINTFSYCYTDCYLTLTLRGDYIRPTACHHRPPKLRYNIGTLFQYNMLLVLCTLLFFEQIIFPRIKQSLEKELLLQIVTWSIYSDILNRFCCNCWLINQVNHYQQIYGSNAWKITRL